MAEPYQVFLSYSRNDLEAAGVLRTQIAQRGLSVFKDDDSIREGVECLLSHALENKDCPLFVISTVRADFLDRFDSLPELGAARGRVARLWPLTPLAGDGLREVIDGPARLAGLEVDEVRDILVREVRGEPGALPLIENALHWLWQHRKDGRLSGRLLEEQGGPAGILSRDADDLLNGLAKDDRNRALRLLFRLVNVDPAQRRHTRRRLPWAEAVAVAGGGERGRALLNRLAGQRDRDGDTVQGPLRLITITYEAPGARSRPDQDSALPHRDGDSDRAAQPSAGGPRRLDDEPWVNLIHETLIASRPDEASGELKPYWPTLWTYVAKNEKRAAQREHLQLQTGEWKERTGPARLIGLAGLLRLYRFRGLAARTASSSATCAGAWQ
jgi:hypothetical protein